MNKNQIVFAPVTRTQIDAGRPELAKNGITLSGDNGVIEKSHCRIAYSYDEATAELTLTVVKKPLVISTDYVKSQLIGALAKQGIQQKGVSLNA
jgi:hypothetical protein